MDLLVENHAQILLHYSARNAHQEHSCTSREMICASRGNLSIPYESALATQNGDNNI